MTFTPDNIGFAEALALHHKGRRSIQPSGFIEFEFVYKTRHDACAANLRDFGIALGPEHLCMRRSWPDRGQKCPIMERKRWFITTFIRPK